MKKMIAALMAASVFLLSSSSTKADESTSGNPYGEPFLIRCTCYTAPEDAITASGRKVREGIIAGKPEWCNKGYVALLYDKDMEFIGFFEFLDTGAGIDTDGDGIGDSIKNGTSIDVFSDSLEGCYEWINKYGDFVYIQIVKGVG